MSKTYFDSARRIAELEYEATMKQNARLEQALTVENTSKLFGQLSEDVNADYQQLNKDLANKLRLANEQGGGFLSPTDWAAVNTMRQKITDKISRYNTFVDAYQKAHEELISNPSKYHGRTSKDNLLSFNENPLEFIKNHKTPSFLNPSVLPFDKIIGAYQSQYKDNTSFKDERKAGYGKTKTLKYEGNLSMFTTDKSGVVKGVRSDQEQENIAVSNLIGLAKGNDEFMRSMQTTYQDIKNLDPEKISAIDAKAAQLYPNDPEAQAYARGALLVIDGNKSFFKARIAESTDVVKEPKEGGDGDKAKVVGLQAGTKSAYSVTSYLGGVKYEGAGISQDVGKLKPINVGGKGGATIKFVGQRIVDIEPGRRIIVGTSYTPKLEQFTTESEAVGAAAKANRIGDIIFEGTTPKVVPKQVSKGGKTVWEVETLSPSNNVAMETSYFNQQSPDYKISEQPQSIAESLRAGKKPAQAKPKAAPKGKSPSWLVTK